MTQYSECLDALEDQRRLSMLELLTTFNVYSYLQKFNAWKLSIIKLCDLEKKTCFTHYQRVLLFVWFRFRLRFRVPNSGFRLFHTPIWKLWEVKEVTVVQREVVVGAQGAVFKGFETLCTEN